MVIWTGINWFRSATRIEPPDPLDACGGWFGAGAGAGGGARGACSIVLELKKY